MGVCYSRDQNTRFIESKLAEAAKLDQKEKKVLFLGPGGSGKSTIFKQLQWLHLDGFTQEAARNLKRNIYSQTITQMQTAVKFYDKEHQEKDHPNDRDDTELNNALTTLRSYVYFSQPEFDERLASAMKYIWSKHPQIKNVFNDFEVLKYQLLDENTEHFWNNIDRLKQPDYIPSDEDILNMRLRTTGVVEKKFSLENTGFSIVDVGGQQSERRKWVQCFNGVHAVLFVISLSSYDQVMFQNISKNCMADALELFDEIVNHDAFKDTHVILFLNKKDLFEKKIVKRSITECPAFHDFMEFDDGSGCAPDPHNFEQTTAYIRHKFKSLNHTPKKQIYSHLTHAMDRKNIDRVFTDVHRIMVSSNLMSSAMA